MSTPRSVTGREIVLVGHRRVFLGRIEGDRCHYIRFDNGGVLTRLRLSDEAMQALSHLFNDRGAGSAATDPLPADGGGYWHVVEETDP